MSSASATSTARIELRLSTDQKALIARAARARQQTQSEFMRESLEREARRALADRTQFVLDEEAWRAWEQINERPARELAGLRELIGRPSPFID